MVDASGFKHRGDARRKLCEAGLTFPVRPPNFGSWRNRDAHRGRSDVCLQAVAERTWMADFGRQADTRRPQQPAIHGPAARRWRTESLGDSVQI